MYDDKKPNVWEARESGDCFNDDFKQEEMNQLIQRLHLRSWIKIAVVESCRFWLLCNVFMTRAVKWHKMHESLGQLRKSVFEQKIKGLKTSREQEVGRKNKQVEMTDILKRGRSRLWREINPQVVTGRRWTWRKQVDKCGPAAGRQTDRYRLQPASGPAARRVTSEECSRAWRGSQPRGLPCRIYRDVTCLQLPVERHIKEEARPNDDTESELPFTRRRLCTFNATVRRSAEDKWTWVYKLHF